MKKRLHWIALISAMAVLVCTFFSFSPIEAEGISKIDPRLKEKMSMATDDELISVSIWTIDLDRNEIDRKVSEALENLSDNVTDAMGLSKSNSFLGREYALENAFKISDLQLYFQTKRETYAKEYSEANRKSIDKLQMELGYKSAASMQSLVTWVSAYTPLIKMKVTKQQLNTIEKSPVVEFIYLNDYTQTEILNSAANGTTPSSIWQGTTNITYVRDTLGFDGSGVKVGVYDGGVLRYNDAAMAPYRSVFTTLYNSGRLIADPAAPTGNPAHAAYCGSVIAATNGTVSGVSPGVTLYSTTGGGRTGEFEGAMEWLISQGVNIISCSIGWAGSNQYEYISRWLDHVAIQHDITVVIASGNDGYIGGVSGGAMSYNAITVGSNDDKNTMTRTDDVVTLDSSYMPNYNSTLPMKPDLVAPGDGIMTPLGATGGTSISCPIVAGTIALLYEMRPALATNQALTKSVLLSGISDCGNLLMKKSIAGDNQNAMFTDAGAGMLDAKGARYVLANNRYVAVTMGSTMNVYTKTFTVSSSDKLTRVNLSWLKNNRLSGNHSVYQETTNPTCAVLYLEVVAPDGTVYKSERNGGNVQNICFVPTTAGTYTIRVKKISAPSSEPNVYFGLSWY